MASKREVMRPGPERTAAEGSSVPPPALAREPKTLPRKRTRIQTRLLVVLGAGALAAACASLLRSSLESSPRTSSMYVAAGFSLTFGVLVWALRAATPAAALCGSMVCLLVSSATQGSDRSLIHPNLIHSGLVPLVTLFVLTFLATRLGRGKKQRLGLAEPAHGRNAAQVIANLGAAGLLAFLFSARLSADHRFDNLQSSAPLLLLAAIAEATADTLSSEIGQAFGGSPWLITRLERVAPGTDGAITPLGTFAGIAGAAMVAASGALGLRLDWRSALIACLAAVAGLFFDSLLGATVERRGWLGNDLVNFSSTVFAAGCAALLLRLAQTLYR